MVKSSEKVKIFQLAKEAYHSSNPQELKKIVGQLLKCAPFTALERRDLSNYLNIMGKGDWALKILGKILSVSELAHASPIDLALQADIASKLIFHSANYTAARLLENVKASIGREMRLGEVLDKWPYYRGLALTYMYRSQEAQIVLSDALNFYAEAKERAEFKFCHLLYLKSLIDQRNYEGALEHCGLAKKYFQEGDKRFLLFLKASEAEARLMLGERKTAKKIYLECLQVEKKNSLSPTLANFYRLLGEISHLEGNDYLGADYLARAVNVLNNISHVPAFHWFPLLYSLEKFGDFQSTFKHRLFLRLFPAYSPYTAMIDGKKIELATAPYLEQTFIPSASNCWLIKNQKILAINSHQFWTQSFKKSDEVIDLASGRFKPRGTYQFSSLSTLQARCLRALLGSAHTGVKNIHLMDYVYRQEFVDLQSGQARLDKLVAHLRLMGFSIKLEETRYYFTPSSSAYFLCLKSNRDPDPLILFELRQNFSRQDVEDFFGVKRSRAGQLLEGWIKEGRVAPTGEGRYFCCKRSQS